jgi:hypothetical protein
MILSVLVAFWFSLMSHANPLGVKHKFSSQIQEDVTLRFVKNSGICETTPGVHQMSGYIDIGRNMSMVGLLDFLSDEFLITNSGSGFLHRERLQKLRHLLFGELSILVS